MSTNQLHPLMHSIKTNGDMHQLRYKLNLTIDEFCWVVHITRSTYVNMEKTNRLNLPIKLTIEQFLNLNNYLLNNNIQ